MSPAVHVHASCDLTVDPDVIFAQLVDFESYTQKSADVLEVRTNSCSDSVYSTWNIRFRGGLLNWTERDEIDYVRRIASFEQTAGDLEVFKGYWSVKQHAEQTSIEFFADYDIGIPTLSDLLNPVAGRELVRFIESMIGEIVPEATAINSAVKN